MEYNKSDIGSIIRRGREIVGSSFIQVHLKEIRRHCISTTMVDDCNGLSNQVVKVERKPHKFMDEGDRWMQVRMFYTETATCKIDDLS